jgi:hypothetical protein
MPPVATKKKSPKGPEYTGVKMDRALYALARKRARERHQTYSDYVRQLIVSDVASK